MAKSPQVDPKFWRRIIFLSLLLVKPGRVPGWYMAVPCNVHRVADLAIFEGIKKHPSKHSKGKFYRESSWRCLKKVVYLL